MSVRTATTSRRARKVTPRELEVLVLVADGYSTREIAKMLWITDETVRTHVRRLLEHSRRARTRAVSIAYREGRPLAGRSGGRMT